MNMECEVINVIGLKEATEPFQKFYGRHQDLVNCVTE